ncbi:hypothetical protein AZH11_20030 [Pseudomonas simiae]|nr:hypothetical protein AZH11_20030 [Pseudomonas simiae]
MTCALRGFSCAAINANEASFPDAHASDSARLQLRVGAPPPPNRTPRIEAITRDLIAKPAA